MKGFTSNRNSYAGDAVTCVVDQAVARYAVAAQLLQAARNQGVHTPAVGAAL
jgi:hypothetical protein